FGRARGQQFAIAGFIRTPPLPSTAAALEPGQGLLDVGLHRILIDKILATPLAALAAAATAARLGIGSEAATGAARGRPRLDRGAGGEDRLGSGSPRRRSRRARYPGRNEGLARRSTGRRRR